MQVPAPFVYERATSVDNALELLAKHGPEARLVSGGRSLLPMMKLRFADRTALIDINAIEGLDRIGVVSGPTVTSCGSGPWSPTPSCWPPTRWPSTSPC